MGIFSSKAKAPKGKYSDEYDDDDLDSRKHHHYRRHWRLRLIIGLFLLVLAFVGVMVTDLAQSYGWIYWSFMVPVFAVCCIILSWSRGIVHGEQIIVNLYKDILHWIGMFLAIKLIGRLIDMNMLNAVSAGLVMLALLALTTYLAGIYLDVTFFFLGLILGIMLLVAAIFFKYLIFFMIPVSIVAMLFFFYLYKHRRDRFKLIPAAESTKPLSDDNFDDEDL